MIDKFGIAPESEAEEACVAIFEVGCITLHHITSHVITLLAAEACTAIFEASHGMQWNAMECNGMKWNTNGMQWNAMECNGMQWNEME